MSMTTGGGRSDTFTVDVQGLDMLRKALGDIGPSLRKRLADALYDEAEEVKEDSIDNCPMELGELRASHETQEPKVNQWGVSVTIKVGGPAAPYALAVHEHLSKHSPPSWQAAEAAGHPVQFQTGGPKFLENAANKRAKDLAANLVRRLGLGG